MCVKGCHHKSILFFFRSRYFRQRGILPAHYRVGESHVQMGLLIIRILLRFHLQDPPRRVECGIGTLLVSRIEMKEGFKDSFRDHATKSAVEERQSLRRASREKA